MRRQFACCMLVLFALLTIGVVISNASAAQNTMVVDNFNDGNSALNSLGYWTGFGSSGNFTATEVYLHGYDPCSLKNNNAKKIIYDCALSGAYAWHASNVWDDTTPLDVSGFDYLSLRVKKESPNAGMYIKIRYGAALAEETSPLSLGDYSNNTEAWQLVNIPLRDFAELDKTEVTSIIFFFDNSLPAKSGILYIDNLEFSKGYAKNESAGSVRIERMSNTLYVDGSPFVIKSVGYQPYPIGTWPGTLCFDEIDPKVYDRDFPILAEMGCNTIRTWSAPPLELLAKAGEYGLKVLAGYWIDPGTDYANVLAREEIKSNFRNFIAARKNSSAILAWGLGNENNYHENFDAIAYYSLMNELGQISYQEEGASYHPVFIVNGGLYWIGVDECGAEDLELNYIDAWGSNLYAREYASYNWLDGTRDIFQLYGEKTSKPLIITEYGVDAFCTSQIDWNESMGKFTASDGYEDQTMQADWDKANILEILASDVCLGASVMAYSDEWWKDMDGSMFDHDLGGGAWWDGAQPDNFSNEEYYGIVRVAPDGTWNIPDGIDDIQNREVYYSLKGVFKGNADLGAETLVVDDYNDVDPSVNSLGFWTGGNLPSMYETAEPNFDGTKCRRFYYCDKNWYASNLWDGVSYLDASEYEYLTFIVKGAQGGESFRMELQYGAGLISSINFSGTLTEWQKINIPLSDFIDLDKTKMRAISIVFDNSGIIYLDSFGFVKEAASPNAVPNLSDIPDQTIDQGESFTLIALDNYVNDPDNNDNEIIWSAYGNFDLTVDIDPVTRLAAITVPYQKWIGSETIIFRATDPCGKYSEDTANFTVNQAARDVFVVDDYNDSNPQTNSLGLWSGGTALMSETIKNSYDGTPCRKLKYSKYAWYSTNVWDGRAYADVSDYNNLSFAVRGLKGNESFDIMICYGVDSISRVGFSDVSEIWQNVTIPLSTFAGLNRAAIRYVGIKFKNRGVIYVDNLVFSD